MIKGISLTPIKVFEVRRAHKRGQKGPGSYLGRISRYSEWWYAEAANGTNFTPSRKKVGAVRKIVRYWDEEAPPATKKMWEGLLSGEV